ncbi:aminotransferase class-III, putative [Babesia ovata]|uniref:Aminotransferase class-III, putative n=1 Tax=Babesia ovata TaxID=189622 RepID=A0A2H6KHT0_9APIC|nr:aminotransferase class-III, putative [Babesia ovata]GBE62541.1 aminotransferase class-III, putative [Babesia ovata]
MHATHGIGALLAEHGPSAVRRHAVVVLVTVPELAHIALAGGPNHPALASDVVVKRALVHHAVAHPQLTGALALVVLEHAHVHRAVGETLNPETLTHIVTPVAVEHVAVGVRYHALPVAQAFFKDALEAVPVHVLHLARAVV